MKVQATGGDFQAKAGNNVALTADTGSLSGVATLGGITLNAGGASSALLLEATGASGTATVTGTASVAVSSAGSATVQAGTGPLLVKSVSGSATLTAPLGSTSITGGTGVTATATSGTLSLAASNGGISASASTTIGLQASTGVLALTQAGSASLQTNDGSVNIAAYKLTTGLGQLTMSADTTAKLVAGTDLTLQSTSGTLLAQSKLVEIDASGADTGVSALLLQSTTGSTTINGYKGVTVAAKNGPFSLTATSITPGAGTGVITADEELQISSNLKSAVAVSISALATVVSCKSTVLAEYR